MHLHSAPWNLSRTDGIWTIFLTPLCDADRVQRTLVCADTLGRAVITMLKDKRARVRVCSSIEPQTSQHVLRYDASPNRRPKPPTLATRSAPLHGTAKFTPFDS